MAMIRLSFLIAICFAMLGCKGHNTTNNNVIFIQNNDFLGYMNYSESEEYYFSFSRYPTISDFSLDAKNQENKIPITKNDSLLIIKILRDFEYLVYFDSYVKHEIAFDTVTSKDLFFCGKISFARDINFLGDILGTGEISGADSVNSFLILTEQPTRSMNYYDIKPVIRYLYLLNFKNNKLTSIVMLSSFLGDVDNIFRKSKLISYFTHDIYISQIDYNSTDNPRTLEEITIPLHEISDYVKFETDSEFVYLYISSYWIDEKGFVQLNLYL